jgi:hypothetical protein
MNNATDNDQATHTQNKKKLESVTRSYNYADTTSIPQKKTAMKYKKYQNYTKPQLPNISNKLITKIRN